MQWHHWILGRLGISLSQMVSNWILTTVWVIWIHHPIYILLAKNYIAYTSESYKCTILVDGWNVYHNSMLSPHCFLSIIPVTFTLRAFLFVIWGFWSLYFQNVTQTFLGVTYLSYLFGESSSFPESLAKQFSRFNIRLHVLYPVLINHKLGVRQQLNFRVATWVIYIYIYIYI